MTVYVDILLFLNIVLDYLIISLTAKFTHSSPKLWRKVLAAAVSSLFSLYIFLPKQKFIVELLLRILISVITVFICFGFANIKSFLRKFGIFYAISFIYAGFMMGVWMLFKPENMSINNGVVYFNISPLVLLTVSFLLYVIIIIVRKFTKPSAEFSQRLNVKLTFLNKSITATAMVDSGHSLENLFGDGLIIIIDTNTCVKLIGAENTASILTFDISDDLEIWKRFRAVPVKTVSGENLMPAVKLDGIEILNNKNSLKIDKPLAVVSRDDLGEDYSVILPPEVLSD